VTQRSYAIPLRTSTPHSSFSRMMNLRSPVECAEMSRRAARPVPSAPVTDFNDEVLVPHPLTTKQSKVSPVPPERSPFVTMFGAPRAGTPLTTAATSPKAVAAARKRPHGRRERRWSGGAAFSDTWVPLHEMREWRRLASDSLMLTVLALFRLRMQGNLR
jgi:hypothetical protein